MQDVPPKRDINNIEFLYICQKKFINDQRYSDFYNQFENRDIILFKNCKISEEVKLYAVRCVIHLINCEIDQMSISGINNEFKIPSLIIENSRIKILSISNCEQVKNIRINEQSIIDLIHTYSAKIDAIHFVQSTIVNAMLLNSNIIIIDIDRAKIKGVYSKASSIENINSRMSKLGEVVHDKSSIGDIHIDGCFVFLIKLKKLAIDSNSISITNSTVNVIDTNIDSKYTIVAKENSNIYELNFNNSGIINNVNYHISDTQINLLSIDSIINKADVVLNNITPINEIQRFVTSDRDSEKCKWHDNDFVIQNLYAESRILLNNSDLGTAHMVGCDFASFDEFYFQNSKMLNVFIADTTLPSRKKIITGGIEGDVIRLLEQQRLALSQFKKMHDNRGDIVRAAQYLAEEMEVYREQLKYQKSNSLKEYMNNSSERINLWLNKFSSYYGNNWLRGVFITLTINSFLFTLYCFSQGYRLGSNTNTFFILSAYSLEFLNPLRRADFLSKLTKDTPNAVAILIDYISRIIISYFVYQTIAAFRKFGKKSA